MKDRGNGLVNVLYCIVRCVLEYSDRSLSALNIYTFS